MIHLVRLVHGCVYLFGIFIDLTLCHYCHVLFGKWKFPLSLQINKSEILLAYVLKMQHFHRKL